jgi:hypothetical protein
VIRRSGHLRSTDSSDSSVVSDFAPLGQGVVFAGSAVGGAGLAQRIAAETAGLSSTDTSIVWVAGPVLRALHFNQQGKILRDAAFGLGHLVVRVPAGAGVRFDDERDCYCIDGGQVTVGAADLATHGRVDAPLEIAAANRSDAGSISLRATVSAGLLSASIRYFYANEDKSTAGFQYPLFQMSWAGSVDAEVLIHPECPLDPARNRAIFTSAQAGPSAFFTVAGQRLLLEMIPGKSGTTNQWDPVQKEMYSAPMGEWGLAVGASGASGPIDLMCGLSGLEFAKVEQGSELRFVPGAPAYAPKFLTTSDGSAESLISDCPDSQYPVTTSWAYVSSPIDVPGYFSQPVTSGLFEARQRNQFLNVMQLRSADLPPNVEPVFGSPEASFPMAPYGQVLPSDSAQAALYRRFEVELLSAVRSNAIFAMNWEQPHLGEREAGEGPRGLGNWADATAQAGQWTGLDPGVNSAPSASGPIAVTPQGMYSVFLTDGTWAELNLAKTSQRRVTLQLRSLGARLRAALLTPQLFLVISDKAAFEKACVVDFPALGISGWTFKPALNDWRDDTVLILKFADKSLEELIGDRSLWSTAGSGLNQGAATQTVLKDWIAEAKEHEGQPEFDYFLNTVLKDWNGIIFANVVTPAAQFPSELRALAAGLDLSNLRAHHLGVNLSPLDLRNGDLGMSDSSLFGLIYYQDSQDLVYSGFPYDFKVLSLRVLFANSEISSFSSQIELLVGELFGERSTLLESSHGDNLILNGVMERHGDEQSYSFSMQGTNAFSIESQVLESVTVTRAQFVTLPQAADTTAVTARILMWGNMRFLDDPAFDVFSFGPVESGPAAAGPGSLQFSNMFVSMTYVPTGPSGPAETVFSRIDAEKRWFAFQAGQMVFDLASSLARPLSLYAHFPVQLAGMVQGDASITPASLGFLPVSTPLTSGAFGDIWFALRMSLSLGSQGGLAEQAGFNASLLAAWAPSASEANALVAVQLPGSEGGGKTLSIQGPLKLSAGSIAMMFDAADTAWLMRLNNIALSLFGLKFPPGGNTNLMLFGDPDTKAKSTTLGWYAAYQKVAEKSEKPKTLQAKKAARLALAAPQATAGCGCSETKRG